jgi:DNA modification methylase
VSARIIIGDCLATLHTLPAASVQCCVTSPPYLGLRDYGMPGQIGLEETPDAYVARLVDVFREVKRVLRDDGTLWLNLGDSYAQGGGGGQSAKSTLRGNGHGGGKVLSPQLQALNGSSHVRKAPAGYKPKDLMMIPAMVALALRADGWWLRSDIIWHKPNPLPESITDRPTSAHEHVFLLSKAERYFYDAKAIAEPAEESSLARLSQDVAAQAGSSRANGGAKVNGPMRAVGGATRNSRNVWTIATQPYSGAHFATMPPELAERCIKAGTKPGDTVLDPFGGAGTTGLVADRLGRSAILCELNPAYAGLARDRLTDDAPLLAVVA